MEKSLEKLEQYQAAYYGRLEQLPYFRQMATVIEHFLKAVIIRGEFYLRVQPSVLDDILASGCIKSMMETHKGTTNGGEKTRREVTEELFGCDTDMMEPADYPKYGFLSQPDAKRDLMVNAHLSLQFGDASIRLKKQRLIHRTTLTIGNSVNLDSCKNMIPTRTDNVKATCIVGLPHGGKAPVTFNPLAMSNPLALYYYLTVLILEKKLTVDNFALIDRIADEAPVLLEYFELQYHGVLSLADDVERIDVVPSSKEETGHLRILKPKFEALGIPFEIVTFD